MKFDINEKVKFINPRNDRAEVGEIQLIADVTECCTTGIVGKKVYYVRSLFDGGILLFEYNLEKYEEVEEQCPCMKEPSYNCGMKCSRCGREL